MAAFLGYRGRSPLQVFQWLAVVGLAIAMFEHGRSWSAHWAGVRKERRLVGVGGLTAAEPGPSGWSAARTAVGVPVAMLLFIGLPVALLVALGVFDAAPGLRSLMVDVAFVNVTWSLFNMLPVLPLDGGRALYRMIGQRKACEVGIIVGFSGALVAITLGVVSAAVLMGALGLWNVLSVMALARRAQASAQESGHSAPPANGSSRRSRRSLRPRRAPGPDLNDPEPKVVIPMSERQISASGPIERRAWNALRAGDVEGAARTASRATDQLGLCPYLVASLAVAMDDPTGVPAMVDAMIGPFGPPNLVVAKVVAEAGVAALVAETLLTVPDEAGIEAVATLQTHLEASDCGWAAAEVAEARLMHGPVTAPVAFEAACCWAAVGNLERALAKLAVAVGAGMTSAEIIDNTKVLAPVRRLAAFSLLRVRLA